MSKPATQIVMPEGTTGSQIFCQIVQNLAEQRHGRRRWVEFFTLVVLLKSDTLSPPLAPKPQNRVAEFVAEFCAIWGAVAELSFALSIGWVGFCRMSSNSVLELAPSAYKLLILRIASYGIRRHR